MGNRALGSDTPGVARFSSLDKAYQNPMMGNRALSSLAKGQ